MQDNSSKQILLSVLGVAILVVAVVGVSFAAFTYAGVGKKENTITTGTITMNYTEGQKGISITNAMPVSDDVGKTITAEDPKSGSITEGGAGVFDFNVNATINGSVTIKYDIMAVKKGESTLEDQYAKLYLQKSDAATMASPSDAQVPITYDKLSEASSAATDAGKGLQNAKLLHTDTFTASATHYYRLRMWVDNSYKVDKTARTFTVTVNVYGQAV